MPYFILAIALASILLVGCTNGGEEQKRAQQILETTKANITTGIEGAKDTAKDLHSGISEATNTIESAATKLEKTAEGIQKGAEKISNAVTTGKEGLDDIHASLQNEESSSSSIE